MKDNAQVASMRDKSNGALLYVARGYFQAASFPSWTSPVRPRSPAPRFPPIQSATCDDRESPNGRDAPPLGLFSGNFLAKSAGTWRKAGELECQPAPAFATIAHSGG